ncbi:helix-hairpin-helix domain-containing protein [Thiotrichales bacterium HSG1]|nr:helix-hairpin-helix domain-containing protein [Thiotrichales bacterium HSG1]
MQIQKLVLLFFLNLLILISPVVNAEDSTKIDINTADAVTLEKLWGVGPQKSAAIVEFRDENGMFESIDDLKKVKGIGQKTIDENQDKIEVIIPEKTTEISEPQVSEEETVSPQNDESPTETNVENPEVTDEEVKVETGESEAVEVENSKEN